MKLTRLKLDDSFADRMVLADADDTLDALEAEYQFAEKRREVMLSKANEFELRMDQLQNELRNINLHLERFRSSVDKGRKPNMWSDVSGCTSSYQQGHCLSYRQCTTR